MFPVTPFPIEGTSGVEESPLWVFLANLVIENLVPWKEEAINVQADKPLPIRSHVASEGLIGEVIEPSVEAGSRLGSLPPFPLYSVP